MKKDLPIDLDLELDDEFIDEFGDIEGDEEEPKVPNVRIHLYTMTGIS